MCKLPDYINKAVCRMNEFLAEPAAVSELPQEVYDKLPFGLSGAYDFFQVEVMDRRFMLVGIDGNEDGISPGILSKHRDVLQSQTGLTPFFIFDKIASYNFPRYARKSLNVIAGNRQLFLPAIFLIAEKENQPDVTTAKAPAFVQLLVLFHLQKEKVNGSTMKELAEKLKVSYATVNRGIRWMHTNSFISLSTDKEKRIQFLYEGKALWDKVLPYLETPIEFIAYTPQFEISDKALVSEQNALAEYSLYGGGFFRVAISKEVYRDIKDRVYWDCYAEAGVEVWKYDPCLLSDNGVVDRLSLYLILKDYEDERVQIELENMMNEISW